MKLIKLRRLHDDLMFVIDTKSRKLTEENSNAN